MLRIDTHIHTTASKCSIFPPHELVSLAVHNNIPVIVTTNHRDSYGDTEYLKSEFDKNNILYFPAIEINNNWGDFLLFGEDLDDFQGDMPCFPTHILPRPDIAVIWAHPLRYWEIEKVESIKWEVSKYIDAVEAVNGNCILNAPGTNELAKKLAEDLQKPMTGGSDAHANSMFFIASTQFYDKINSYRDFINAIKSGRVSI